MFTEGHRFFSVLTGAQYFVYFSAKEGKGDTRDQRETLHLTMCAQDKNEPAVTLNYARLNRIKKEIKVNKKEDSTRASARMINKLTEALQKI